MFKVIIIFYNQYQKSSEQMENNSILNQYASLLFVEKQGQNILMLKSKKVATIDSASRSTVLSLARYILSEQPQILPPNFKIVNTGQIKLEDLSNTKDSTINNRFFPWGQYLGNLILNKQIAEIQGTHYFFDYLGQEEFQKFEKFNFLEKRQASGAETNLKIQKLQFIKELYELNYPIEEPKPNIIHLFNLSRSQLIIQSEPFKPRIHILGLYVPIFFKEGDVFICNNILKGQIPTVEQLSKANVLMLTGSSNSVLDKLDKNQKVADILFQALKVNQDLKILGFCFGHQLMGMRKGAKVERRKTYSGMQQIQFIKQQRQNFPQLLGQLDLECCYEHHEDNLTQTPEGFTLLASSKSCQNQAMISKDKRILSFQFHIEYLPEYAMQYENRFVKAFPGETPIINFETIPSGMKYMQSIMRIRRLAIKFMH